MYFFRCMDASMLVSIYFTSAVIFQKESDYSHSQCFGLCPGAGLGCATQAPEI